MASRAPSLLGTALYNIYLSIRSIINESCGGEMKSKTAGAAKKCQRAFYGILPSY